MPQKKQTFQSHINAETFSCHSLTHFEEHMVSERRWSLGLNDFYSEGYVSNSFIFVLSMDKRKKARRAATIKPNIENRDEKLRCG